MEKNSMILEILDQNSMIIEKNRNTSSWTKIPRITGIESRVASIFRAPADSDFQEIPNDPWFRYSH